MKKSILLMTAFFMTTSLSGCGLVSKLSNVGDPPDMSHIQNPTLAQDYRPVSMPRANRVGDVITVLVALDDKAKIDSNNTYNRQAAHTSSLTNFLGLESKLPMFLPKAVNPTRLTNTNSNSQDTGRGLLDRKDTLDTKIGATIIQILPNGNLVIQGRQEILFGTELRVIDVRGVIRREDIASDNTIPYSKIAEARIAYGGRGDITDVSSVPWGQQVLNKILPW